jgi:hypothetical protein
MTQFFGIDVLGRAATKTVVRMSPAALFVAGRGSANDAAKRKRTFVKTDGDGRGWRTTITLTDTGEASGSLMTTRIERTSPAAAVH